jgi:hypothetical protein
MMKTLFLSLSFFTLGVATSQATLSLLGDPVASSASSSFSNDIAGWGPQHLYDANPTIADIGTDITGAFGTVEHASAGGSAQGGQQVVVFDYGVSISTTGFAFAQRDGNGTAGVDKFDSINLWVTDTDPGAATTALPGTLGAPNAMITLVGSPDAPSTGQRIFDYYNVGQVLTGQYVIFQMNDDGVNQFNPGGNELQLGFDDAIPEPTSGLLGLLGLSLLLRRRR